MIKISSNEIEFTNTTWESKRLSSSEICPSKPFVDEKPNVGILAFAKEYIHIKLKFQDVLDYYSIST